MSNKQSEGGENKEINEKRSLVFLSREQTRRRFSKHKAIIHLIKVWHEVRYRQ